MVKSERKSLEPQHSNFLSLVCLAKTYLTLEISEQIARSVKAFFGQSYNNTLRHVLSANSTEKKNRNPQSSGWSKSAIGKAIWQVRHSLVKVQNAELQ